MDWAARLNFLADQVSARADLFSALHSLVLMALLVMTFPVMMEPWRRASTLTRRLLLLTLLAAALIRLLVIPAWARHVYDGHEADYYDVWRGARSSVGEGYRASEWMVFLYRLLGPLLGGSGRALVVLQVMTSLVSLMWFWQWVRDLTGQERAGLWAVLLASLDPVLGFWASSAYNIQLPLTCAVLSLAALERAIRRPAASLLGLSAVAFAASVAGRPESMLVALPLAWRCLPNFRRLCSAPSALPALLGGLSLTLWPILSGMKGMAGANSPDYMREMFGQQWKLLLWFNPWGTPWLLAALGVVGVLVVRMLAREGGWLRALALPGMLLGVIVSHQLAYALFDDYDYRHTLLPRLALMTLLALGMELSQGMEKAIPLATALAASTLLVHGLVDVRHRYYAGPEDFYRHEPLLQTASYVNLDELRGCIFVAEDLYYGRFARASHFELYTQRDWKKLTTRSNDCVLFVYDLENFQASSRSIDGRAHKVMALYRMELLGKVIDRQAEHYSLVYRVLGRRDGSP